MIVCLLPVISTVPIWMRLKTEIDDILDYFMSRKLSCFGIGETENSNRLSAVRTEMDNILD